MCTTQSATHPLVFDCDGGVDDMLAVCAANLLGLNIKLVVASQGCVTASQCRDNLIQLYQALHVKSLSLLVNEHPCFSTPPETPRFFGNNGLNNMGLKGGDSDLSLHIPRKWDFAEQTCWLGTGPVTKLAELLLSNHGRCRSNLQRIVLMGGCFDGNGLVGTRIGPDDTHCAEFNVYHDAFALHLALVEAEAAKIPVVLVSWDECKKLKFPESELRALNGANPLAQSLLEMTREFFPLYPGGDKVGESTESCYVPADLVALAAMIGGFGETRQTRIEIDRDPLSLTYGMTSFAQGESGVACEYFELQQPEALKQFLYNTLKWK